MIRRLTLEEEIENVHLTEEERKYFVEVTFPHVWAKVQASLPPEERKCWKVTDRWGNTIKRYATKEMALDDAISRNKQAESLGLHMRYRVSKDQGFDE